MLLVLTIIMAIALYPVEKVDHIFITIVRAEDRLPAFFVLILKTRL